MEQGRVISLAILALQTTECEYLFQTSLYKIDYFVDHFRPDLSSALVGATTGADVRRTHCVLVPVGIDFYFFRAEAHYHDVTPFKPRHVLHRAEAESFGYGRRVTG